MPTLFSLAVLWWLGACAPSAQIGYAERPNPNADIYFVRGQGCFVPGADGPLPLSRKACAEYGKRPYNRATFFVGVPGEGGGVGEVIEPAEIEEGKIGAEERPAPR